MSTVTREFMINWLNENITSWPTIGKPTCKPPKDYGWRWYALCGEVRLIRSNPTTALKSHYERGITQKEWLESLGADPAYVNIEATVDYSDMTVVKPTTPALRSVILEWLRHTVIEWPTELGRAPKVNEENGWVWAAEKAGGELRLVELYEPKNFDLSFEHGITEQEWKDSFTSEPVDITPDEPDQVRNPKHYQIIDGVESITLIAAGLTIDEWRGFCLGNIIKYRLRAGKKDALEQDIGKAEYYEELFEKFKHLCRIER